LPDLGEFFEALRDLEEAVTSAGTPSARPAPAEVTRLSMRSPLEIIMSFESATAAAAFAAALTTLVMLPPKYSSAQEDARAKAIANRRAEVDAARAELELDMAKWDEKRRRRYEAALQRVGKLGVPTRQIQPLHAAIEPPGRGSIEPSL
jgi:hypothetical protein